MIVQWRRNPHSKGFEKPLPQKDISLINIRSIAGEVQHGLPQDERGEDRSGK